MQNPMKDERVLSLEHKLNSLMMRISDLERRLAALERDSGVQKPATQVPKPVAAQTNVKHNYLRRTIGTAKRDYDRKYR